MLQLQVFIQLQSCKFEYWLKWKMAPRRRAAASKVYGLMCLLIILGSFSISGTQTDVNCLKRILKSVEDPNGHLSRTWDFSNKTEGSICRFNGIDCWDPEKSRVLSIKLSEMGLKGQFPLGIEDCTGLMWLDLSNNNFSGPIPSNISQLIPFVTKLDLSNNTFSGEIRDGLANCTFLNDISLDHNQLSGQIPSRLGYLWRLKSFNVADNHLSGQVPEFDVPIISKENYANNPGLCGGPLRSCSPPRKSRLVIIVVGAAVGLTLVVIVTCVAFFFISRMKVIR